MAVSTSATCVSRRTPWRRCQAAPLGRHLVVVAGAGGAGGGLGREAGELAAGVRLPASRELARLLGISRNTVTAAYEQLLAEGFLDSRSGDGTYVAPVTRALAAPEATARTTPVPLPSVPPGAPCAFRVGLPAVDLFPFATWARLQQRFWRQPEPAQSGV